MHLSTHDSINKNTAKASLQQMLSVVFSRMEAKDAQLKEVSSTPTASDIVVHASMKALQYDCICSAVGMHARSFVDERGNQGDQFLLAVKTVTRFAWILGEFADVTTSLAGILSNDNGLRVGMSVHGIW